MVKNAIYIDYPLHRTKFDIPVGDLLDLDAGEREFFIRAFLNALSKEIDKGTMALKQRVTFKREIADYRRMLRLPIDYYLLTDNISKKRNVLAIGAPGQTHTYRSRTHMWQMVTKQGSLLEHITEQDDALLKRLTKLFDPNRKGKEVFRKEESLVPPTIYRFMQMNYSVGAAFPPFHARFLVSRLLPKEGEAIVVDPCAGWGGRMLGTLCARRADAIRYIGVDPAKRNQNAYEELRGLYFKYLSRENKAKREANIFYAPFERWVKSNKGKSLYGKVDLVFTSPPYFDAENYEASSKRQSANAFKTYEEWRAGFYIPFIQGAFSLLKVGGHFVLNVADTASAPCLERDARLIAKSLGFSDVGFFKLAMPSAPGTKGKSKHQVTVNEAQFKYEPVFVFQKKVEQLGNLVKFDFPATPPSINRQSKIGAMGVNKAIDWVTLRGLYKPYDKTCNDSFKRIKQKDKPSIIFLKGKPIAGAVINRRGSAGYECLYKGKKRSIPCIKYEKGDIELSKFSVFDTSAETKKLIIDHLRGIPRPCIVEVNSVCKTEIELLKQSGFSLADASVNSMGDVYHLYIDSKNCDSRKQKIDDAERINVKHLSELDFTALAQKIEARLRRKTLTYRNHDSQYNMRDSWGGLSLRGYTPSSLDIESLDESAGYQRDINNEIRRKYHPSQLGFQDTNLMEQFPEVQKILDRIIPNSSKNGNIGFKRVRFMRITPNGGELARHTDLTDQTLGIENGKTVRLHVPIKTNAKVKVTSWSLTNFPTKKHFAQGELWYLNIRLPHKVINGGEEDRIHLVIDAIADEKIRALINGEKASSIKNKPTTVRIGKRSSDADHYLSLVESWVDPYPAPVIENHEGFWVVRDDLLPHGSKMRFIDHMVRASKEKEFVFGASNKVGWGAISLSAVCKRYGKKAVFFMAKTSNPTEHQLEVLRLGGQIHWVGNGMLNVTKARAREYADADPKNRRLLPIGLEDDTVLGSIIKVARGIGVKPKEIWTAASSGTLSRGLQLAFPKAKVFAVQTGHSMSETAAGRAEVIVSPYKYDKRVSDAEMPPYPSEPFYDAKVWRFVQERASKGALVWNVAGPVTQLS